MNGARSLKLAVLCVLAICIGLARLHTYDEALERDIATYAVIGQQLNAGRALYTDVWDHKPPAVYATYALAQRGLGAGSAAVFALGLVTALATLVGIHRAAALLGAGSAASVWAAAFWAAICSSLILQANQPNTEAFINAALVWAFVVLLALDRDRFDLRRVLFLAALFALASLYKHTSLVSAAALGAIHVGTAPRTGGARTRALGQVAAIAAIGACVWMATALYFQWHGRFADFWNAVVVYNQGYAGGVWTNLAAGLEPRRLFPSFMRTALPLVVLAAIGAAGVRWRHPARGPVLLFVWALSTFPAVALPGRFYPHYYQLWLPPLCIAAGVALTSLSRATRWRATLHVAGSAVLALVLWGELPNYWLPADQWSARKYGSEFLATRQVGRALDRFLPAGETFYNWGDQPGLYYYSGRRPPSGVLWRRHLIDGPGTEARSQRVVRDLEREAPELIIAHPKQRPHPENAVVQWFEPRYQRLANGLPEGSFHVYYRKGGAVEARLSASGRLPRP